MHPGGARGLTGGCGECHEDPGGMRGQTPAARRSRRSQWSCAGTQETHGSSIPPGRAFRQTPFGKIAFPHHECPTEAATMQCCAAPFRVEYKRAQSQLDSVAALYRERVQSQLDSVAALYKERVQSQLDAVAALYKERVQSHLDSVAAL